MEETIKERLQKIAEVIHFFGKYPESDLLLRISIYLKLNKIETDDDLNDALQKLVPDDRRVERAEN